MELRTLAYFRMVADEGSITNAANAPHVTQPTLSRQIAQLERELGQPLFLRGHGGVELTERGAILYRYACDILDLADKAEGEVALPENAVSGTVHIGAGETKGMVVLARAMRAVHERYPGIDFELRDGTSSELMESFVKGYFDLLLECDLQPYANLNALELPVHDVWGALMRVDDPLAKLDVVRPEDLEGRDCIASAQSLKRDLGHWLGASVERINMLVTCTLPLNAFFLAEEGVGVLLTYDGLVDERQRSVLYFRKLAPHLEAHHGLLWRKTMLTRPAQVFLDEVRRACDGPEGQSQGSARSAFDPSEMPEATCPAMRELGM